MMSVQEKNDVSIKIKVCYNENSNDIRLQYANRPSSPTGIVRFY